MKSRVITALAVMPVVLAAICYTQTWPLMILGGLVVLVAGFELYALLVPKGVPLGLAILLAVFIPPLGGKVDVYGYAGGLLLTGIGALAAVMAYERKHKGLAILAEWYVAVPIVMILWLHQATPRSAVFDLSEPLFLLFLPLWAADIAGILAGMGIGKHLLAPNISPKKTIEGSIANLFAAVGVAIPLSTWLGYDWTVGLWCGLAIGILGQAGDLFESWLKRRAGVKDSGAILPGHGGVLDRIDSLLFSAPAVCLILANAPRR